MLADVPVAARIMNEEPFGPVAAMAAGLRDVAALAPADIRRGMPRFEPANYAGNLRLLPAYEALARLLVVGRLPLPPRSN